MVFSLEKKDGKMCFKVVKKEAEGRLRKRGFQMMLDIKSEQK